MPYKVDSLFKDPNGIIYQPGDDYPRAGLVVDEARVKNLMSAEDGGPYIHDEQGSVNPRRVKQEDVLE